MQFFKGEGNKLKYSKFYEPLGIVFEHHTVDIKRKRIYKACRVIEFPWFAIRLEITPKIM